MKPSTIRIIRRGEIQALANVPPDRTLLDLLREDMGLIGTKEGCGEGDCGACTVVLGEAVGGKLSYRAVNSCIRLAHSVNGLALWTVEDLASDRGLHPAQQAMVDCHGSQCGFCTPGFVMSLFGMYQNQVCQGQTITREGAQQALSGNLCRCTGYRPILDAAQAMGALPRQTVDEPALLKKLKQLERAQQAEAEGAHADTSYLAPQTLAALLAARAAHPQAQVVAGCTDVGLWVTKQHKRFAQVLDLTRVKELRRVENYRHHIAIGAAVPLQDAFAALVKDRPQLASFAARFAGLPVRNSGTLGGNVANGSPIGDSMPLLIALGANVVLMSVRGHRELPLEQLYTGYRQNVLAADELLAWIKVPKPTQAKRGNMSDAGPPQGAKAPLGGSAAHAVASVGAEFFKAYKISKRYDDDISAVCLCLNLELHQGLVAKASIGVGGVAATPVRAVKTQAALLGAPWNLETVKLAAAVLTQEFQPISDMRASAAYRQQVLGNLLQRYWLESQGMTQINLESFSLDALEAYEKPRTLARSIRPARPCPARGRRLAPA